MERHAPVHEEVILSPGVWQTICPRADHGHVMIGPIIHNGHLSSRLATLRSQPIPLPTLKCDRLTPREAQIAELVAQGLTSAEIGAALWITENTVKQALKRMYRKLKL